MPHASHLGSGLTALRRIAPGLVLCIVVTAVAYIGDAVEARLFGRAWLEALVLAILVGASLRTAWTPPALFGAGIDVASKLLLEIAIVLLGLSVSAAAIVAAGPALVGGIVAIVVVAIGASYAIGRGFGLSRKLALLIACGNSICGNTAIAATAPVIHADGEDVGASIAFTAVLGVVVVLTLPFSAHLLRLSESQYGILAGLTVYSVPQVLVATVPIGPLSVQVGMLVKLIRVLMLGPVLLCVAMAGGGEEGGPRKIGIARLVPWFILGFLAMIAVRSSGCVPPAALAVAADTANVLTVVAMAALGLSVDVRCVARAGLRVTSVVVLSLSVLGAISFGLIRLLGTA